MKLLGLVLVACVASLLATPVAAGWLDFIFGKSSRSEKPALVGVDPTVPSLSKATEPVRNTKNRNSTSADRWSLEGPMKRTGTRYDNTSHIAARHSLEDHITRAMKEKTTQFGHLTRAVFIGDTTLFQYTMNQTVMRDLETQYAVISLAGPADKTENMIHRLAAGFLKNISGSAAAIIMAGGNNVVVGDQPASVAKAIGLIASQWKSTHPMARIYIVSAVPRYDGGLSDQASASMSKTDSARIAKVKQANVDIKSLNKLLRDEVCPKQRATFIDVASKLYLANGTVDGSYYRSRASASLSFKGQQVLTASLAPIFKNLTKINRPLPEPMIHLHLQAKNKGRNMTAGTRPVRPTTPATAISARGNNTTPGLGLPLPRIHNNNVTLGKHSLLTAKQAQKVLTTQHGADLKVNVSSIMRAIANRTVVVRSNANVTDEFKGAVKKAGVNVIKSNATTTATAALKNNKPANANSNNGGKAGGGGGGGGDKGKGNGNNKGKGGRKNLRMK